MSTSPTPPPGALFQLLSTGPIGLVVLDGEGCVVWANEVLLYLLESPAEALVNRPPNELTHPWLRALSEQDEFIHVPTSTASGTPQGRWLHCRFYPRGDGAGAVGHVLDFTEIKQLVEERDALKHKLAELDPVEPTTGLLNARGLTQVLAPQVARSRRYGNRLSAVLLRLGETGEFIERYPGAAGEAILTAVTRLLNDQLRWADFIAYLEQGEFALVLQETGGEDALALVAKLRDALADLGMTLAMPIARFGIAEWQRGDDVGLLLRRARNSIDAID